MTNVSKTDETQQAFRCIICGYVYNPVQGDPETGVQPDTSFSEIEDGWLCPVCNAGTNQFEPIR